jgi:hypothetical protein
MDELDTSLHAFMARALVQLVNNPETDPKGAQLVFTTHDTSLLDPTIFRRDQIWFTEKDQSGASDLYSLQDYSPRKGEAIQKGYLLGHQHAFPVLVPPVHVRRARPPEELQHRVDERHRYQPQNRGHCVMDFRPDLQVLGPRIATSAPNATAHLPGPPVRH